MPSVDEPFPLEPGERLTLELPGGGGFGPPGERDPRALARDLAAGVVSPEAARTIYGVDPDAG